MPLLSQIGKTMVARLAWLRKMGAVLVACLAVVLLPSEAWAEDCVGPDDPPGCVTPAPTPTPTPTVTVTETAAPTATPTVTETATVPGPTVIATVMASAGVVLAPGQTIGAEVKFEQWAPVVLLLATSTMLAVAGFTMTARGRAH